MNPSSKIYIAGHEGMVGSAIHRCLVQKGYKNFRLRTLPELDLTRQSDVERFFEQEKPEYVIDAAAKVGGILANNTYRAQFIYDNLMIQNNLIHSSYRYGAKKLLFLGSSCIYPKNAPQPMKEEHLLRGVLEQTNEPYAIAKIAGIKMCESYYRQYGCNFVSVMPTNLYGPNDNYNLKTSHVLPALVRKMHLGKCMAMADDNALRADLDKRPIEGVTGSSSLDEIFEKLREYGISRDSQTREVTVTLWGTGSVYREFMHADDMAAACVFVLEEVNMDDLADRLSSGKVHRKGSTEAFPSFLNVGTGSDIAIKDLAEIVRNVTGYKGKLAWDASKPDGTKMKLMDVSILQKAGFRPKYTLEEGIRMVYGQYTNG